MKLYRIQDWIHFLGFPLMGFLLKKQFSLSQFTISLLTASALLSFAYGLNDYFDKNMPKKYLAYLFIPVGGLFSLLILFPISKMKLISILIFFVIAILYSTPPIRLKAISFIGTMCNGFGFPLLFFLGIDEISQKVILFYLFFSSLMLGAEFIHELAHKEQDKNSFIFTTAVYIGERRTKKLILSSLISGVIIAYFISKIISLSTLILLIYLRHLLSKKEIKYIRLRKKYKMLTMTLGLLIAVYLLFSYSCTNIP